MEVVIQHLEVYVHLIMVQDFKEEQVLMVETVVSVVVVEVVLDQE
jgi:hypothetical protein